MAKEKVKCLVKIPKWYGEETVVVFCTQPTHKHRLIVFGPKETAFLAAESGRGNLDEVTQKRILDIKLTFPDGRFLDLSQQRQLFGDNGDENVPSSCPSSPSARSEDTEPSPSEAMRASSRDTKSSSKKASSEPSGTDQDGQEKNTLPPKTGGSGSLSFGSALRAARKDSSTPTEETQEGEI